MPTPSHSSRVLLLAGLALSLAGLLWHAERYRFFTDDAFIAFRYARNLSDGFGLVFNPGHGAVEGFSSPLWVLLLAGCAQLGLEPPSAASLLSLLATLMLWGGLVRLSWSALPAHASRLWVLLPVTLLALTRSFAVWSSGGLETRFFEALVMLSVLRLWQEARSLGAGQARLPWGGLLLGCVAWTRPEGALLVFSLPLLLAVFGERSVERGRWLRRTAGVALALLLSLFLARLAIFGEWLPNTYYAKLDGQTWWRMGSAYLGLFALEYGLLFWLPLLGLGLRALGRRSDLSLLSAGACLPLLLYMLAIGGDHFEFRSLNLLFPYAFLFVGVGAAATARSLRSGLPVAALLILSAGGLWFLPDTLRRQFPAVYQPGYPGLSTSVEAAGFPRTAQHAWLSLPGLRQLGDWHRALLHYTSTHFVGLRQEEHRLFFLRAASHGKLLARLVDEGRLPRELHIAIDCVGAIPYESNLRCLDRLGLTDQATARAQPRRPGLSAHSKYATEEHAVEQGVDLWALHPLFLVWSESDPNFQALLAGSREQGSPLGLAELEPGLFLLAALPQGLAATQARFPELGLRSSLD